MQQLLWPSPHGWPRVRQRFFKSTEPDPEPNRRREDRQREVEYEVRSVLTDSQTGSCAKLPLSVILHIIYTLAQKQEKNADRTSCGVFCVNEVFCEVSVFGEKTGGVGRGKDMSRQKVLGNGDSLDSGLNRVNL